MFALSALRMSIRCTSWRDRNAWTTCTGGLMPSRCSRAICGTVPFDDWKLYRTRAEIPHCRECGALVRPHICWFGEVPFQMELILQQLDAATVLLTVGTSGVVEPAASFVRMARRNCARTIYVGPEEPSNSAYFDEVLLGKAGGSVAGHRDRGCLAEEASGDVVGSERRHISNDRHVSELDRRPLPAVGLAPHHCDGGHALHGEGKEHQQRDRSGNG
jgi:hypothetical protein